MASWVTTKCHTPEQSGYESPGPQDFVACVHRKLSRFQRAPLHPRGSPAPHRAGPLIPSKSPGKAWDKSEILFKTRLPKAALLTTSLSSSSLMGFTGPCHTPSDKGPSPRQPQPRHCRGAPGLSGDRVCEVRAVRGNVINLRLRGKRRR